MTDPVARRSDGALRVALSNVIGRIMSEYTGRGPVKTRCTIHGDTVVVLMHTNLTKAEEVLVAAGEPQLVLDRRRADQRAMAHAAKAAVTDLTGREVVAFMSAEHLGPELAAELFVLDGAPLSDGGPGAVSGIEAGPR